MNERIKKLAEQAGLEFDGEMVLEPEPIYYTSQKDLEKFAELIVRECIKQARKDENGPAYEAVGRIAEHFGVE